MESIARLRRNAPLSLEPELRVDRRVIGEVVAAHGAAERQAGELGQGDPVEPHVVRVDDVVTHEVLRVRRVRVLLGEGEVMGSRGRVPVEHDSPEAPADASPELAHVHVEVADDELHPLLAAERMQLLHLLD